MSERPFPPVIAFAGSPVDRADHLRCDPEAIERLKRDNARLLLLDGLDPVIAPEGTLAWGMLSDVAADAELVFLGIASGQGCFAPVAPRLEKTGAPPNGSARAAMQILAPQDLATYGGARSLVSWHARHRFCAQCGAPTRMDKGGWQRTCREEACRAQHFPRVDPVTIMTVEHDGRLLLGRQAQFPPRFYSALAGFVEPGETIEEAVARETYEEAGVRVRDVTYVASQPWPFPSSLMIGCHAYADDPAITIDTTELEDVRWFDRADVALAIAQRDGASFQPPPAFAIAHHLMRWWLENG